MPRKSVPSTWAPSSNQRAVDTRARSLRETYSRDRATAFLRTEGVEAMRALVDCSPFRDQVDAYPHPNALAAMAFNLSVTEAIVRDLCSEEQDPEALAFVSARVAELGLHSIHDPHEPGADPHMFLAASKQSGYFFTPPEVAQKMAASAMPKGARVKKLLDPGAGIGSLLAAALIHAKSAAVTIDDVYAVELDEFTLKLAEMVLQRVRDLVGISCDIHAIHGDVVEVLFRDLVRPDGYRYDCIVMNPPYGRVKFLRSFLTNSETRAGDEDSLDELDSRWKQRHRERADQFRAISKHLGLGVGAQDYHRLFLGLAISVLDDPARLAIISPSSWLGDSDSTPLRRRMVRERLLEEVHIYPEGAALFATVNQPTAVAVVSRNGHPRPSFTVRLMNHRSREEEDAYAVEFDALEKLDGDRLRIPRISHKMHEVYDTLQEFPRLRDLGQLKNARGELDLTFGKRFITSIPTPMRLVRGDHIERYVLRPADWSERESYIDVTAFQNAVGEMKKAADIKRPRLVGRQVSYLNKGRRLSFALVPEGVVLGNSCNYICLTQGTDETIEIALNALATLTNSLVLEWYFRIFNSNNHVANYEIDDLPLCMSDPRVVEALAVQGRFLHSAYESTPQGGKVGSAIEDVADAIVAYGFGLSPDQVGRIAEAIEPHRTARLRAITNYLYENGLADGVIAGEGWFNHLRPSLSELDMEVIRHVPQGGNWQDIPESVPSQRLVQIREMTAWRGLVRTTYYGRLRPDQPAYTIATYYNRPGNGTNITPWEDRTLTSREAARLQSFPDWYVFLGNDGAVRKQVGNAVPPLLGYALGQHLQKQAIDRSCVDLFAGAGGLSLGLELAGWDVKAAADNDVKAAQTYCFNRACEASPEPESGKTLFLESDLTKKRHREETMVAIDAKLAGQPPSLLVGGPPCQGFSHAGWRAEGDERNHLASIFMMFVERLAPEIVVLENVEGLLTYGKGQVVADLIATLHDLGYAVGAKPWLLRAECYGVPQMRRRVFVVASKTGVLDPPVGPFQHCRGRRESDEDSTMFEGLPYPVTAAEALADIPTLGERTHKSMGRRELRGGYSRWCKGLITTEAMLNELAGER